MGLNLLFIFFDSNVRRAAKFCQAVSACSFENLSLKTSRRYLSTYSVPGVNNQFLFFVGDVITVTESEIIMGIQEVAKAEGILLSPEGSATWKAITHLLKRKIIATTDKILLLNTGSGYKYLEKKKA